MEVELEWEGDVDPGLVTRPRRSRAEKVGVGEEMAEHGAEVSNGRIESGLEVSNVRKENGAEENVESQRSVYLDASEGIESTDTDVGNNLEILCWPGGEGKQENGAAFEEKDMTNQNGHSIPANSKQSDVADVQPTSNLIHSGGHEIEIERTKPVKSATEELLRAGQENKVKQEVAEYDLERIIEEQETHDLYCPNCHSCITKRVILRKRKRFGQVAEKDPKREKLTSIQPDLGVRTGTSGDSEQSQEPDVFRCLSCFSFFTATASGIFRIFQRRGEGGDLQTSQPPSVQNLNAATSTSQFVKNSDRESGYLLPYTDKSAVGLGSQTSLSGEKKLGNEAERTHLGNSTVPNLEGVGTYFSSTMTNVAEENKMVLSAHKAKYPNNVLSNAGKQGEVPEFKASENWNYTISSSKDSTLLIGKAEANSGQKVVRGTKVEFSGNSTVPNLEGVGTYFSSTVTNVAEENKMVLSTHKAKYPNNVLSNAGKQGEVPEFKASENWNYTISSSKDSTLLIGKTEANSGQKVVSGTKVEFSGNDMILHAKEDGINGCHPSSNLSQNLLGSDKVPPLKEGMDEPMEELGSQTGQDPPISAMPGVSLGRDTQIHIGDPRVMEPRTREWDVLKSIVYGGLVESVTSLGVVSSAAGSDATTLKIIALGVANVVAGLIVLAHNLKELANDHHETLEARAEEGSRYYRNLGRRANLRVHVVVAILCYIIFGLIPPVVYGFSFRRSDNKEYKLIAVAGASLLSILLLSIGKAHVQRAPKPYIKTILYYLSVGLATSGLAYVAGKLVKRLLENTGLFDSSDAGTTPSPPSFLGMRPTKSAWRQSF
ncbi:membrane protein of ER body-like protein isoform X2 [Aristolochia californica]|uniref:membrane protein of ER body-like protein isoform X2 n=1 Tax=Aristolochia californica TaxID=171875 RepID=UPI0035DE4FC5